MTDSLEARFAPVMRVDEALTCGLVSFQDSKRSPGYRWYRYKEAFSAALVHKLLDEHGIRQGALLDPFAGSGTALFAAAERGTEELKGGVDPAGADEHWKTTRSALARIRTAFAESEAHPPLFFIGAAIVRTMAGELWRGLENNTFANAANLTDDGQLAAVAQWIRTL